MLCSRFRRILFTQTASSCNIEHCCIITTRLILKQCRIGEILTSIVRNRREVRIMTSLRFILRDFSVNKLRSVWSRSVNVSNVVRRYRRDKSVREVILCFRQAFFRPRRTLLLSATAAYKAKSDDDEKPPCCDREISDEELEALLLDLDTVEELTRTTLYCVSCNKRLVIDKRQPGVRYCICKESKPSCASADGWEPYMEAEDVVIWRKEYKHGQGLYAYKVYGRYREVIASHFAAVQVNNGYRRVWDSAVAALSVVERSASIPDQAVLHWEVLWPRLFANRDYVYIRRHKEYNVTSKPTNLFEEPTTPPPMIEERPSVHSNAKRKSIECYNRVGERGPMKNKVYVVVSRSCQHKNVPESKHAIRVNEYWSNMVVRTIEGAENPGMEFVLTYYDEPAVGGLPSGVATWATGRAAPAYLGKMRLAAKEYAAYKQTEDQVEPDFQPPDEKLSYEEENEAVRVNEQEMESSKEGPDLENGESGLKEKSTQTEAPEIKVKAIEHKAVGTADDTEDNAVETDLTSNTDASEEDTEDPESTVRWWRYLHPFYYFV